MTEPIRSKGSKRKPRDVAALEEQAEYARRRKAHEALQAELRPEMRPLGAPRITTHFSFRDVNKLGSNAGHTSRGKNPPNPRQRARRPR